LEQRSKSTDLIEAVERKERSAMTKQNIVTVLVAASLAVPLTAYLWADSAYTVERPQGYRRWTHVMSYVIGPQSPASARNGGLHNFYANEKALEGYRTGTFPDGSILIDERNQTVEDKGITRTGDFLGMGVMVKDNKRYGETSGCGYEVFSASSPMTGVLGAQGRTGCFNCHQKQKDHDSVFTSLRE
jgi:hypothetical protein